MRVFLCVVTVIFTLLTIAAIVNSIHEVQAGALRVTAEMDYWGAIDIMFEDFRATTEAYEHAYILTESAGESELVVVRKSDGEEQGRYRPVAVAPLTNAVRLSPQL